MMSVGKPATGSPERL